MKVSYRREIRHNYLIIDPEELCWDGYESQMLSRNTIEGLLQVQFRQMEEGIRFYYEITSRQPLSRLLAGRNIRAGEIKTLIAGIFRILERMDRYLLKEEHILLEPEYIYVEPEEFRVWLCLVPGLERDFPEMLGKLLEYLLGCVDRQDQESVVLAYGLYQETRMENFGVDDILKYLYGSGTGSAAKRKPALEEEGCAEPKPKPEASGREAFTDWPGGEASGWKDFTETSGSGVESFGERPKAWTEDEKIRSGADGKRVKKKGGGGTGIRSWLRSLFHGKRKKTPEPASEAWKGMFQEQPEQVTPGTPGSFSWDLKPEISMDQMPVTAFGQAAPEDPMTVFLGDVQGRDGTRRLRALDPDVEDISIDYYPFVIGKQAKLVDYQLKKDTVSRLHLRIDRDGDCYQAQDLNSTNGTYIGGRLLENNESAPLRIGDEVQIADVRFRFE